MTFSVKQARQMAGYTQVQMAEKLGVNRDTYRRIEAKPESATILQGQKIAALALILFFLLSSLLKVEYACEPKGCGKGKGEAKVMSDKNIPPDVQIERDNVTIRCGERETVATKDGIRIRERSKIRPDSVPMDDSNKPLCV